MRPMTRREFLRRGLLGSTMAPWIMRQAVAAEAAEEDLLEQARERIARHRRRRRTLLIRDARGRPVSGARVRVEMLRHEFLFGCNLFRFDRLGDDQLEQTYRERFAGLFNFATLGFYWAWYEPRPGEQGHGYVERVLDWTAAQSITCKGHPLVWDHPAGSPRWLPEDDAELARRVEERVREIVGRFRGRLDIWDVVNEPTHLPDRVNRTRMARWGEKLGPVAYTRRPLEVARAAHPGARLLVNDYRLDDRYYEILDALRDRDGQPLYDAVGLQSHMHGGLWPLARIWRICDRFARLGRPLHFTETTLVSGPRIGPGERWGPTTPELEARQAEQAARFYTMVFAHPAVEALTWWDFSDRGAWQGAAAGLLRRDMSPKPAYERLHALIRNEWWTRAERETDSEGRCSVDAFHGRYRIRVEQPSRDPVIRELDWSKGAPDRTELTI